jgi:hypothetical protein
MLFGRVIFLREKREAVFVALLFLFVSMVLLVLSYYKNARL